MKWFYNAFVPQDRVYLWTSIWVIIGGFITWLILHLQKTVNEQAACLWATGLILAGAIVGLIFAIPKILSNEASSTNPAASNKRILQENTNLFQVSDWFTKTIVGAGLVELKNIPAYVLKVASKMAEGMAPIGSFLAARSFCAGIIVYSISFGFIVGYLVTRLVINQLLADIQLSDDSDQNSPHQDNITPILTT